jgi:hypothetical protein
MRIYVRAHPAFIWNSEYHLSTLPRGCVYFNSSAKFLNNLFVHTQTKPDALGGNDPFFDWVALDEREQFEKIIHYLFFHTDTCVLYTGQYETATIAIR